MNELNLAYFKWRLEIPEFINALGQTCKILGVGLSSYLKVVSYKDSPLISVEIRIRYVGNVNISKELSKVESKNSTLSP